MNEIPINAPNLWRLDTPGHSGWERTARVGDPKKYFMVSTDSHANEPPDLWEKRIDPKYRERVPRIITDDQGVQWRYCEGYRPDRVRVMSFEGEDWVRSKAGADVQERISRQSRRRGRCRDHFPQQRSGDVGDARSGVRQRAVPGVERLGLGTVSARIPTRCCRSPRSRPAIWRAR